MRLSTIICCLLLNAAATTAQKCNALADTVFDSRTGAVNSGRGASGPSIVYQKQKTRGTTADGKVTHLWLRRDFISGPSIMMGDQHGSVSVNMKNYTFLYGELGHDSTLRDPGEGNQYHGKVSFIFADGDSISLQTYPIAEDRFYPNRQNISFIILLNNHQYFPNDKMRKTFGIRKAKAPGETALRDKLKATPLKQLRYTQSYAKRNVQGVPELHYTAPITITYTAEEAKTLQQATDCLTRKVVDKRFP